MIVMDGKEFVTAQEACQLLGVKAATLYAYVSRGVLHSYRQGIKRARLYLRSDIEDLTRLRGPGEADGLGRMGAAAPSSASDGEDDDQPWIPYV
jgi:excisionase family DNA binding protein